MYNREFTPDRISELKTNEIFVFGSNLGGFHGGGAARAAYARFGAIWGQGVGLQGQSYAIPTMQGGVETIKPYVDELLASAVASRDSGMKKSHRCSRLPLMLRMSSCPGSLWR